MVEEMRILFIRHRGIKSLLPIREEGVLRIFFALEKSIALAGF
jgi:hypothetical protein